jgi:hypothetical protein
MYSFPTANEDFINVTAVTVGLPYSKDVVMPLTQYITVLHVIHSCRAQTFKKVLYAILKLYSNALSC